MSRHPRVEATARDLVRTVLDAPPTLGAGRLVCVDGPAGSGKTTLAAALNRGFRDALRSGRAGRYRRYDWHRSELAEERVVEPCRVLVVEGVGSGNAAYADVVTLLVWVDTPSDVRLQRGLERDGEQMREHWLRWRVQEDAMFALHRTRERADVVVDGAG